MRKVKVTRVDDVHQTLGVLHVDNTDFTCKTLELKWQNNENNVSCIPVGTYICKYTRSNRLSEKYGRDFFTYEIMDVKGRGGVRIHSANHFHQLRGCIALGSAYKDIDMDGANDILHSGQTIKDFEKFMNYEPFELEIKYNV